MLASGQVGGAVNSVSYSQYSNGSEVRCLQSMLLAQPEVHGYPGKGRACVCVMACKVPAVPRSSPGDKASVPAELYLSNWDGTYLPITSSAGWWVFTSTV